MNINGCAANILSNYQKNKMQNNTQKQMQKCAKTIQRRDIIARLKRERDEATRSLEKERIAINYFIKRGMRERDEAITALDKMSKYLAQFTGSCPYECFDIEPHSDPCSEICDKFTNETSMCWKQHFMKEVEK